MLCEIIRRLRAAMAFEIGGRGACDAFERGDRARDEITVRECAVAQHTIDAFANHVHPAIAFAHGDFDVGIICEELRQARHQKMPRNGSLHLDAEQYPWERRR